LKSLTDKIIEYNQYSPISLFYEFGFSPDDIKSSIVETFSDYFQNQRNLQKYAISDLVDNWLAHLTVYRDDPNALKSIDLILKIFNEAKQVNQDESIKSYVFWYPDIYQSISRFWSLYNSQAKLDELCLEDFLAESLRAIGQTIEGILKPFLKLLLQLNRIRRHKAYNSTDIQSKDLGVVIDELISTTELADLLIITPGSIRLNQWRNIAYHHNSKVINNEIICWYKKDGSNLDFKISRSDLLLTLKNIVLSFKIVRISETIICFDNFDEIQKLITYNIDNQINIREEAKLLSFYTPLNSQGFEILDLQFDKSTAVLKLRDLQEYLDFSKRAIHSSQFVYNLWVYTDSNKLIVEYYTFNGNKFLISEIKSDNFINVKKKSTKLSELLKEIEFTFVSTEFSQNKDPFSNLTFSKEIKNYPQNFFSQKGKKISLREFSKQFTLAVFSNYLAFASEGIKNVKINTGSDGSIARSDDQKRNILLHVPARIENKNLQLKLIELLGQVIELYEKGELQWKLVEEAKINNKFFYKKDLIKKQLNDIEIE